MRELSSNEIREIAILFKKKLYNNNPDIFELIPTKLLFGFYAEDYEMFLNKDSKGYPHFLEDTESCVFGFNKPINEYMDEYNKQNLTYNEAIEKIFEEIKNKKYLCNFEETDKYFVQIKEKGKSGEAYKATDIICDIYNAMISEKVEYYLEEDDFKNENYIPKLIPAKKEEIKNNTKVDTIKLYKTLKEHIIGQDEGLQTVVGTIWKNYNSNDRASNMIIIGPTGVGKTETSRIISDVIGVPIAMVSANQFSQVGYVGDSTTDILKKLIVNANGDIKKAERGIIVIDEIDKIAINGGDRHGVSTEAVQNELLKMIEDGTYVIDGQEIKTKNITFIALGAFDNINKGTKSLGFGNSITITDKEYKEVTFADLEAYGTTSQLLGRLPVLIPYNNLSEEDFREIMLNSKSSFLLSLKNLYKEQGIDLEFNDEIISLIAKKAIKLKHGVRGVESILIEMMKEINFVISQNPGVYKKVIAEPEMVNNCKKYVLK